MRPIAIIEAERPGLDSVILWDAGERLVGFAYLDGKVTMTRPLEATEIVAAAREACEHFQITESQLTRVADWQGKPSQRITPVGTRWN